MFKQIVTIEQISVFQPDLLKLIHSNKMNDIIVYICDFLNKTKLISMTKY